MDDLDEFAVLVSTIALSTGKLEHHQARLRPFLLLHLRNKKMTINKHQFCRSLVCAAVLPAETRKSQWSLSETT